MMSYKLIRHAIYKGVHRTGDASCGATPGGERIAILDEGQLKGPFPTDRDAALAYLKAAFEEQAKLNFSKVLREESDLADVMMLFPSVTMEEDYFFRPRITHPIYKGVYRIGDKSCGATPEGEWTAELRGQSIGKFDTAKAAAFAYYRAALQEQGSRAYLNFGELIVPNLLGRETNAITFGQSRTDVLKIKGSSSSSRHHVIDVPQLEEEQGRWKKLGERLRSRINHRIEHLPKELYLALLPVAGQFLYQNALSPVQDAITKDILVLANGLGFLLLLGGMLGLARRWKHAYLLTLLGLLFAAAGVIFSMAVGITGALGWAASAVGLVGFLAVVAALIC